MRDGMWSGAGFVVGAVGFVLAALFVLLQVGLFAPVVREHCTTETDFGQAFKVEGEWALRWPAIGARDDTDPDSGVFCVRNTVTREALGAIGIWPLDEPKEQVGEAAAGAVGDVGPEGSEEYIRLLFETRRESDAAGREAAQIIRTADGPEDYREALALVTESTESVLDTLRGADPPGELARVNDLAISLNEQGLHAAEDLLTAIDTGSPQEIREAATNFDETFVRVQQEYEDALEEIDAGE